MEDFKKRVYEDSGEVLVTHEDFNRIETGIFDNRESLKEHENQINVLNNKCIIPEEERTEDTKPSDYKNGFRVRGLRLTRYIGINDKDAYAHIVGYNTWKDNSAHVHEIAFSEGEIYIRKNVDITEGSEGINKWSGWDRLVRLSEITALQEQLNAISEIMMETNNLK